MLTNLGFECVVRGLRAGRDMKRAAWVDGTFIRYIPETKEIMLYMSTIYGNTSMFYQALSDDIMATDWCIV